MSQGKVEQAIKKKGKAIMQRHNKVSELTKEYDGPFSICSHEEGKKLHSLLKRKFILQNFFNDDVLCDIGVEEDMILLSDELGWTKFFRMKLDTFYELTL